MSIERILMEISENDRIKVDKVDENYFKVYLEGEGNVLKIYRKSAEFLDIEDEWDELRYALREKYKDFPELIRLTDYMNQEKYDIIW